MCCYKDFMDYFVHENKLVSVDSKQKTKSKAVAFV